MHPIYLHIYRYVVEKIPHTAPIPDGSPDNLSPPRRRFLFKRKREKKKEKETPNRLSDSGIPQCFVCPFFFRVLALGVVWRYVEECIYRRLHFVAYVCMYVCIVC